MGDTGSGRAAPGGEYVDASFGRSEEGGFSDDAGLLASKLPRSLISGSTVSRTDAGRIAFNEEAMGALCR